MSTTAPSNPDAPGARSRAEFMAGMACVNTSGNERIPILMELVGALSRAKEPQDVLREFAQGMERIAPREGYVSLSTRGLAPGQYRITRMITGDEPWHTHDSDPWRDGHKIPVREGGFLGALIRQAYPEVIHDFFLKDDPVVGDALAGFGSLMAIPLFDNGEVLNWAVMLRKAADGFTVEELEETILRGNLVGSSVKNVLITKQLREANAQIRREVEQIASIQRALLPKQMPDIPGVTISATYETYDQAGGDYYDFLPLCCDGSLHATDSDVPPDSPWGLLIADASGHGPAAAVLMAMLHAILHAYPKLPEGPAEVLEHANAHLCHKSIQGSFVTAFFGIFDPVSRRLTYASAGHPPSLLKSPGSGGAVQRLDAVGGVPLGVLEQADYENAELKIQRGQTLVLYTDGITESMSPDRTMFGVRGIEHALECCSGEPTCVPGSVTTALRAHEAGVRPGDDQTLVALRVE